MAETHPCGVGAARSRRDAGKEPPAPATRIDPFLMAVLSSRFEAIIREMTNTVMKASRSAVIKMARDFSCGLLTYDHRLISTEEGIPIHVTALDLTTRPIVELFDDIAEGDAYINNCPYLGNTHHADITIAVPVFCDGEPMFWTLARSHHADMGAPIPTTYLPHARTIYEEGVHFPCMRIERGYEERKDIVRIGLYKIRVSKVWYGDYRAQVGACRIGERRLKELVEKYGRETIRSFIEEWIAYGERRAIAAIRELPAGTYAYETCHDPVPGVAENGIPVKVEVTVDSEEGAITVDVRDNIDCVPGGLNLSECTATGSCRIGVFNNLDPTIPHNEGSARRVRVLLRDGSVVGRPAYPVGTSVATTNVNDRLINAVNCVFSGMGVPFGQGEGGYGLPLGTAVVSGVDFRKERQPYVNQMFIGFCGGGGVAGHDGWVTYLEPASGAMIVLDSVEVDESMYPILIEERRIAPDTMGHGEWDGAPGMTGTFRPLADDMTLVYCSDGNSNPPRGVLGGHDAEPTTNWKRLESGEWVKLPDFHVEVCKPTEAVRFVASGGGGYGDPVKREPERVAETVNRGWLTPERAEKVYRVKLRRGTDGVGWEVDEARTAALRGAA